MEQGKTKQSILLPLFNKKELEVVDILNDLHSLFNQSILNNYSQFPKWGIKKKRSSTGNPPVSSSSPLPCHHSVQEIETKVEDKVQASSPASPLSFSPCQSDEKPKHYSKKRGRDEWMGIIEELTQSGKILKGEVERVRNYYNQLQAHNMELKSWKQKILVKKEEDMKNMSLKKNGVYNGQHFGISAHHQQQYLLVNQFQLHQLRQPIGPRSIPDLNVSAEEVVGLGNLQPLDHSTMMITREGHREKRLMRRIIRTKKRNEQRCK